MVGLWSWNSQHVARRGRSALKGLSLPEQRAAVACYYMCGSTGTAWATRAASIPRVEAPRRGDRLLPEGVLLLLLLLLDDCCGVLLEARRAEV
jgi:hypothetical protein